MKINEMACSRVFNFNNKLLILIIVFVVGFLFNVEACTIVAVSGNVTADGRPLLLKNRDSSIGNLTIRIGKGLNHTYLCHHSINYGYALAGYNDAGFAIVNSDSYNMPNSSNTWNAYIMQLALERCATVDEFAYLLDTITKPVALASNYGVMDAQGNVTIIESNAYAYTRFDVDSTASGYLIRTNYSMSEDTTGICQATPTSLPRYLITSSYLDDAIMTNGFITKEDLLALTRCLIDSDGNDLHDYAPFDEYSYTPVPFRCYVPRYISNGAMVIQGLLPNELPKLTVAWSMVGPPMASVTVPYLITPEYALPHKAKLSSDGHSWFSSVGQQLKNDCFVDNVSLDLAKLYDLNGTGVMQKIEQIEEEILERGNRLVDKMRTGTASCIDVENYYSWIDGYVEEKYGEFGLIDVPLNGINEEGEMNREPTKYYDILGRHIKNVRLDAIIKKQGNIGIIIR